MNRKRYQRLSNPIQTSQRQMPRSFASCGKLVFEQDMFLHRLCHSRFELLFLHRFDQILHDALLHHFLPQRVVFFTIWLASSDMPRLVFTLFTSASGRAFRTSSNSPFKREMPETIG